MASLSRWHGDVPAWRGLCLAREALGDTQGVFEAAAKAAALAPDAEIARSSLAKWAPPAEHFDIALETATELIRMNPTGVEPYVLRAEIYIQLRTWDKAEADCRSALAIHPLYPLARLLLAACLHQQGDTAGGRKEADTAVALATHPEQREEFLQWYRSRTK